MLTSLRRRICHAAQTILYRGAGLNYRLARFLDLLAMGGVFFWWRCIYAGKTVAQWRNGIAGWRCAIIRNAKLAGTFCRHQAGRSEAPGKDAWGVSLLSANAAVAVCHAVTLGVAYRRNMAKIAHIALQERRISRRSINGRLIWTCNMAMDKS